VGTLFVLVGGIFGMLATAGDIDRSLQTPATAAQIWVPVSLLGTSGAISQMLKFTLAVPLMLVIFMILNPRWRTAVFLSRMFALGCAVNGAAALGGFDVQPDFTQLLGRSAGFANLATHLSLTGVLGFGVAIGWAVSAKSMWSRLSACLIGFLCMTSVVLSGTRAAFIACAVIALFFGLLGRARGLAWLVGIGTAGVALLWSISGILPPENAVNRLLGGGRFDSASVIYSNQDHLVMLQRSLDEIGAHPLTGTGFYSGLLAHNFFIGAANIGGPLAVFGVLVAVGTVLFFVGTVLIKGLPAAEWSRIGPLAGVLGFIVFGQFQNIFWDRYIWFFVCVALVCLPDLASKAPSSTDADLGTEPAVAPVAVNA